jgi:hypothetical protein
VAQRVGRGIALLFHDLGTRRGWVFNSTPRPYFTPGIDPVPIVEEESGVLIIYVCVRRHLFDVDLESAYVYGAGGQWAQKLLFSVSQNRRTDPPTASI